MKKITRTDLVISCLEAYEEDRKTIPGEIVKCLIYKDADENRVLRLDKPTSIIYYPSTKPGYMMLKAFYAPFTDDDYYKKKSFDDVFQKVDKQIEEGFYRTLKFVPFDVFFSRPPVREVLENGDRQNLKEVLRFCLNMYSLDFFTSNLPQTTKLKQLYGKIIHDANYEQRPKERDDAKRERDKLHKAEGIKHYGEKKPIPLHLYIRGMREYLLKITERLREYLPNRRNPQGIPTYKNFSDKQIKRLKKDSFYEFTEYEMAGFFKCSYDTIEAKIKEENKYAKSPEKALQKVPRLVCKQPPLIVAPFKQTYPKIDPSFKG